MAEKPKAPAKDNKKKPEPPKKKSSRGLFIAIAVVLVLIMLTGGAIAAGIYFKLIDLPAIAAQYKLYDYPLIGKYFPKPATNFETVDLSDQPPEEAKKQAAQEPLPAPLPPASKPEETKENIAKAKQEEAKRISRLARLYGEMKPDEAVPILKELDDPTVLAILAKMEDGQAAKIMALFDAKRAARLTQDMLKGKTI